MNIYKVWLTKSEKYPNIGASILVKDFSSIPKAKSAATEKLDVYSEVEIREYDISSPQIIGGAQDTGTIVAKRKEGRDWECPSHEKEGN